MKKLFIMLFAAIMLCSCGNNYQVGNQKEQAIVRMFIKNNNLDFTDYYIKEYNTVNYHQGLVYLDTINNDTIRYIDFNSVVYEYANKDERYNNVVYLIEQEECMFILDYLHYISDYGETKYYKDYCKRYN